MTGKINAVATINAEKLAEAIKTVKTAAEQMIPVWEQLAKNVRRIGNAILCDYERREAVRWATVYKPRLVYFYRHTKKRRIRKKYEKKILAWYREEVAGAWRSD